MRRRGGSAARANPCRGGPAMCTMPAHLASGPPLRPPSPAAAQRACAVAAGRAREVGPPPRRRSVRGARAHTHNCGSRARATARS
eukprot:2572121-Prymnesium_polylepis.1